MLRIKASLLFITFSKLAFSQAQDSDILLKLRKLEATEEFTQTKEKPLRFDFGDKVFATKSFQAVILKGSLVQTLDGESKFLVEANATLRFNEIEADGVFSYIVDRNGKPQFVCQSKDIKKIDHISSMRPAKILFEKEKFEYKKINIDQVLLLNTQLSYGMHNFILSSEAVGQQSVSLNLESGFKNQSLLPFMITTNLSQLSSSDIEWNFLSFGLKLYKDFKMASQNTLKFYLEAQRAFLGQASLQGNSVSLDLNRFLLGATLNTSSWLFSIEAFNERIFFPGEVKLSDYGIEEKNSYKNGLAIKIGKQFEINL